MRVWRYSVPSFMISENHSEHVLGFFCWESRIFRSIHSQKIVISASISTLAIWLETIPWSHDRSSMHSSSISRSQHQTSVLSTDNSMFAKKWTLYSPWFDAVFFFSPFVVTFLFVQFGDSIFPGIFTPIDSPIWFFVFAIIFDVWHVWGTLYRGYLRRDMRRTHQRLLICVPILSIAILSLLANIHISWYPTLYLLLSFLAYVALFHFIRQQIWFVRLYDRRTSKLWWLAEISRRLDDIIVWIVTGFPFLYWMMHYNSLSLNWFIPWEYISLAHIVPQTESIWIVYIIGIILYAIYQLLLISRWAETNPLKYLYIAGTAYIWYNGMVAYDSIIIFGLGNILLHGLNYYGLIIGSSWTHGDGYPTWLRKIQKRAIPYLSISIIISLIVLWYGEEFFWDQFIWQEKSMIFSDILYTLWHDPISQTVIVSLLGSVQLTHYILDRYIWRTDFGPIL